MWKRKSSWQSRGRGRSATSSTSSLEPSDLQRVQMLQAQRLAAEQICCLACLNYFTNSLHETPILCNKTHFTSKQQYYLWIDTGSICNVKATVSGHNKFYFGPLMKRYVSIFLISGDNSGPGPWAVSSAAAALSDKGPRRDVRPTAFINWRPYSHTPPCPESANLVCLPEMQGDALRQREEVHMDLYILEERVFRLARRNWNDPQGQYAGYIPSRV